MRGGAHQDLKRETPVIAQQGLDGVEVEHELREAAGSVRLGQMLISWQRQEGAAAHLRERGLSSLVWCLQRGEDPACGQDRVRGRVRVRANKVVSSQAPVCERSGGTWRAHPHGRDTR